jgi:hypothetical protein
VTYYDILVCNEAKVDALEMLLPGGDRDIAKIGSISIVQYQTKRSAKAKLSFTTWVRRYFFWARMLPGAGVHHIDWGSIVPRMQAGEQSHLSFPSLPHSRLGKPCAGCLHRA